MNTLANFTTLVNLCLDIAREKYGVIDHVDIRYDIKGQSAGQAGCVRNRMTGEVSALSLRFNKEALQLNWDDMSKDTIPHEVAHIVAYARPELGADNHNTQWRRIAQSLGCSGKRTHNMKLTPGRRTTRYKYVLNSGKELLIGPKHHAKLRAGHPMFTRNSREIIVYSHFKGAVTT
jgi:SprT protein